jgi:hypothetical protein
LPAILITTRHPQDFQLGLVEPSQRGLATDSMLLIPLRKACKSRAEVVPLLQQIFEDIKKKSRLTGFEVAIQLRRGQHGALVDALILEPNISGIGVDLKKILPLLGRQR